MTAKLTAEARRLCEVAEIEVSTLIDLQRTPWEDRLAATVHRGLKRALLDSATKVSEPEPRASGRARDRIRRLLADDLNRRSQKLLRSALVAFQTAMAQDVTYEFAESSLGDDEEPVVLTPAELPFVEFHDEALEAALELRSLEEQIQLRTLQMAHAVVARRMAELQHGGETDGEVTTRVRDAEQRLTHSCVGLPTQALTLGVRFVDAMEVGSAEPACIPVGIRPDLSAQESEVIAAAYSTFGSELRYAMHGRVRGRPAARLAAKAAWSNYRSCGQALRIIGAWLRSLAAEDRRPTCAICYRHVTALSRCDEHATKTHETRAGRLGKRVRPEYLRRFMHLSRRSPVALRLSDSLGTQNARPSAWVSRMRCLGVPEQLESPVLTLAHQLSALRTMFAVHREREVQALFGEILQVAVRVHGLPQGRSLGEMRGRARLIDDARALLSLKGFMRAWYGRASNWLPFPQEVSRYGFDPAHPCLSAALDPHWLPRDLLRQRAWEEAFDEFVRSRMPDASDIQPLLDASLSPAEIAQRFNTSHQTIRNNLKLPRAARRRNRL